MDTKFRIDPRILALGLVAGVICSAIDCIASEQPLQLSQQGFEDERSVVRSALGKDLGVIESSNGRKAEILIAKTDLDGDDTDEIVARVVHGGYCGSGGCLMMILRRDRSGTWRTILESTAVAIAVSEHETRGFRDLSVRDGHDQVHLLAWNGERYEGTPAPAR